MTRNFEYPGRSPAFARHGMVATSHPSSTLTAVEVLKAGGNAMDAAIAAVAVQSVVEAGSTGIGGDCFAMISLEGSTDIKAYNGSGRTPEALTRELLVESGVKTIERSSPHAVTVPGAVDAWARLTADYGRLSLAELLVPAIELARQGYVLTPRVASDLAGQEALLAADPASEGTFLIDGKAGPAGTVQRQPLLADALEAIGRAGSDAFYRGDLANDMVSYLRGLGGRHTLDDFAAAAGEYVTPISTKYRGRTIYECPPNGQGAVALLILNILSRLPMSDDPFDLDSLVRILEATRLAYAARDAWIGDPSSSSGQVERMLSNTLADHLAQAIDVERAADSLPDFKSPEHTDTVYISVIDKDRNAVSLINSLFSSYGSGLMAPKSGVLFHNRGMSFSLEEGHPNEVGPRKRPMHTIIPGIVAEGDKVIASFGVMGGHYQAMGHAHLISRLLDCGLDIQAAIDLPRFFPVGASKTVQTEELLRNRIAMSLERRGYSVTPPPAPLGGAQGILIDWDRGVLVGGSDPRKDGLALGC